MRTRPSTLRRLGALAGVIGVAVAVALPPGATPAADPPSPLTIEIHETVSEADGSASTPPASATAIETITARDTSGVFPPLSTSTGEAIGIADFVGVFPPVSASTGEAIGVADSVALVPSAFAPAVETIGVTDVVGVFPPVIPNASEHVGVADTVTVALAPVLQVGEGVAVHDDASVTLVGPPPNSPPVPSAGGPYTVPEGGTTALHGTATDPDGGLLTYSWDLDGNGTFESAGPDATFSAATLDGPTLAMPVLRVCDNRGACATAAATVTVTNVAPEVTITAPANGAIVATGTPVAFAGSFTDPGIADTHTAAWSFGAAGLNATHTFAAAGLVTITLTVTDDDGGVGTASIDVVVVDRKASVTGAGWFRTPGGRTSFVIAAAYVGMTPLGRTAITTPLGRFNSTSYRYLVVSGTTFDLDGLGTFNTIRNVPFHLNGVNGRPDRLRVRIGSVYDSGGPVPLGGGQILIRP